MFTATTFSAAVRNARRLGHRKRGTYAFAHLARQNSTPCCFVNSALVLPVGVPTSTFGTSKLNKKCERRIITLIYLITHRLRLHTEVKLPNNIAGHRTRVFVHNKRHSNPNELLCLLKSGNDLSSRSVSRQVLSARVSLTSVFGMGTGGSSLPLSPEWLRLFDLKPLILCINRPKHLIFNSFMQNFICFIRYVPIVCQTNQQKISAKVYAATVSRCGVILK